MRSSPDRASCQHNESGWSLAEDPAGRDLRMPRSRLRWEPPTTSDQVAVPMVVEDGSREAIQRYVVSNSSMPWMPAHPKSG